MSRVATVNVKLTEGDYAYGDLRERLELVADDEFPAEWYLRQIAHGRARVFHCFAEGERVGVVLWRTDFQDWGREFVIVAAAGWSEKFDLANSIYPRLEMMAQAMGHKSVRFHTRRAGLIEKMTAHGFCTAEYVQRKRLA